MENEHYLRDHPELSALVNSFVEAVLEARPANPIKYAVDFFSGDTPVSMTPTPTGDSKTTAGTGTGGTLRK